MYGDEIYQGYRRKRRVGSITACLRVWGVCNDVDMIKVLAYNGVCSVKMGEVSHVRCGVCVEKHRNEGNGCECEPH